MTEAEREAAALAELEDLALFESRPRTLKEIGARLSLSRQRVQQIQNQALKKLRAALAKQSTDVRAAWLDGGDEGEHAHGTTRAAEPWF
jgi:DNA-directed RNA polymerase sigma subunit (sigma70/sigma32)